MHVSDTELKEFIIDSGLVAKKELDAALVEAEERDQSLSDVLVSRGALTEDALRRVHSYILGIPFVSLQEQFIPTEILGLIPEPIARTHNIIAFKNEGDILEVALLDIEDLTALDAIRKKTGLKILPRLTDTESMRRTLLHYQTSLKNTFGNSISTEALKLSVGETRKDFSDDELKKMAEDLPIVRIVDTLLRHAIVQGASDIHIEPLEDDVLVRYRIGGILHDAMTLPKTTVAGIVARVKVLSGMVRGDKRLPQDGRFSMETETDHISFRVSILPTFFGEKVVLRLLQETGEGFTLEMLGFHGEGLEHVHRAISQKSGIIFVSGPPGSGKTTTLYTLLDILNRPNVNIATIEDPIEYQIRRVNQTQVNTLAGFTFANGLRALMRQDPDIIMVGEIRNEETASLAVSAALSGRLVLAAIEAESAADALSRLITMGVDVPSLSSAVRAVIGQRLVRKLGENKEAYEMNKSQRAKEASDADYRAVFKTLQNERLINEGSSIDDLQFFRPVPSLEYPDGYRNHIGIHDILIPSPVLQELMLREGTSSAFAEQAKKEGMLTLLQDGLYMAARGMTSMEEVARVTTG